MIKINHKLNNKNQKNKFCYLNNKKYKKIMLLMKTKFKKKSQKSKFSYLNNK